jgi:RNase P/RNase MRP subunit p29
MAIDIKFDLVGNPEPPTIILATRNGNKLGQLYVDTDSINLGDKFIEHSEFTFTLNKYIDGKVTNLWDKVVDFKLVYCKEWDTWFEITVELDEATKTVKTVLCKQLGHAELSQIMLYDIEINTEKDIARDDYKVCVLYNEDDPDASILDRLIKDKAPHYSIAHVDPTIAKIQRAFSFNDKSICDSFEEIAEEIGCLFVLPSNSDESGKIQRTISVYDLQQTCNVCGHRGEFTDVCPKCNSTNITVGYGEDTLIFVTADELATEGIQLTTDTDSVKNCFKLEAGDNLITATVRNCNPNGTDYIWRFSDDMKEDMSSGLVEKLESYDELYKQYYSKYKSDINAELLNKYNSIVDKYLVYNKNLHRIDTPIVGYSSLMNAYYNTIDLSLYLKSSLMPNVEMSKTNAEEQAKLLTSSSLSSIAVANIKAASLATINNTVLAMAKIIVKSTYKVQVNNSELIEEEDNKLWKGNFTITNYSDEEDSAISNIITVEVNDDIETFIEQKIEKALNKENTDDLSISGLFKKEYNDFCIELKKYALNPLVSFRDACHACIDILIEQGVNNDSTLTDTSDGSDGNLYENLYVPYYDKLKAIEEEIKIREDEIGVISGVYDTDNNLTLEGLQTNIEKHRTIIQDALNFERYLGAELWLEFSAYRREDKFSNDNYISDGLNNAELFKKALEFFEVAENEIYKSSELQYSISTTLNNLLAIPKFKNLAKSFKVGNWIRIQIDNKIYKLRLISYEIDFGDFNNINVEFSDVTKIKNSITDIENVLSQASSMATSYGYVKRQASQGEKSNSVLINWIENGLNATNTKIITTENQNQVWDKNGILCREYDPITDTYNDEQLKIINSTIAITDDNWKTTKTAIGKYYYIDPNTRELKGAYGVNGETIVGKLLIGERLDIVNDNGNLEFGADGLVVKNDKNIVSINPSEESVFNISNDSGNIFSLNDKGELVIVGNITASNLTLIDGTTIGTDNITGLSDVAISGEYKDLKNVPTKLSDFTNDGVFITKDVNNLTNYYKKTEADKLLDLKVNTSSLAAVATSGSYTDLKDIEEFKNWVLAQIDAAIN